MRIAAHRGNRLHAPENTRASYLSAYTAGADVIEMDVQLTKDGRLVMSHDGTTDRCTGTPGVIAERTLAELRQLDFSRTFQPRNAPSFRYYTTDARHLPIPTFEETLDDLPDDVELLIELKHDSSLTTGRREEFVGKAVRAIQERNLGSRVVLYSKDPESLAVARKLDPEIRLAAFDWERSPADQLQLLLDTGADGLVVDLRSVLDPSGQLTSFGKQLEAALKQRSARVGAIVYPHPTGLFSKAEYDALRQHAFVWSLSTDSMLDVAAFTRQSVPVAEASFSGTGLDRELFALGYAKANDFCEVTAADGVRVKIREYDGPLPTPKADPVERRLQNLDYRLIDVAREWPYYAGGGVGLVKGIRGDFSAEVDYTVVNVAQATTLEMAALNVDPGAHRGTPPKSFRDKDSFYDPHGAPPYVGVEHDEDDGFRINWNLGSEYDNNQYGKPVGDGKTPRSARLRLERRGPYFAAYYRNEVDARDWVCVGVTRNDSLNPVVYLRCVGKRWRQEREDDPSKHYPILSNEFTFTNLMVKRFVR